MINIEKLIEYRFENRKSVDALAQELKINRSTLSQIINKRRKPSPMVEYQINKLLSQSANIVMNKSKSHKSDQNRV